MFLNELGVDEAYRRRGVATALLERLTEVCRDRGCGEMFVLTEPDDEPADATYRKSGGTGAPVGTMFTWTWT